MAYQNNEWTGQGLEQYYHKFIELQERLRKSEEERLQLEMKFNTMIQVTQEEEQLYYKRLKTQYKRFMEETRKRQERNEQILLMLERIENRAAIFEAKSKRFKLLRSQYQSFLQRIENERRVKGVEQVDVVPKGITSTSGATLNEIIDHQLLKPVRMQMQTNATRYELRTADQLLSRFKESSNQETAVADDIIRSIYARNSRRNAPGVPVDGTRRVTIEDDTDESSTEVTKVDHIDLTKPLKNGHIVNLSKNISSEDLNNVDINGDEEKVINDDQNDIKLDQNQNSLEVLTPIIKEPNLEKRQNSIHVETAEMVDFPLENNLPQEINKNKKKEIDNITIDEISINNECKNEMLSEIPEIKTSTDIKNNISMEKETEIIKAITVNQAGNEILDGSNFIEPDPEITNVIAEINENSHNNEISKKPTENNLEAIHQTENELQDQINNGEINLQDDENQQIENIPNGETDLQPNSVKNNQETNELMEQNNFETDQAYQNYVDDSATNNDNTNNDYNTPDQQIQYDTNEQQIYYDENGQEVQYDANAKDYNYNMEQYDENGQPLPYNENYENYEYDENGQIVNYTQQVQQENVYYDENGQAVGYNQEVSDDQILVGNETATENNYYNEANGDNQVGGYENATVADVDETQPLETQIDSVNNSLKMAQLPADIEENAEIVERNASANVLDLLDTESESTLNQQDVKQVNESDFDFSSTSEAK